LVVVNVRGVDCKIHAADDFLVSSGQSECAAILDVGAGNILDASDMRISTSGCDQKYENQQDTNLARAGKTHGQPPKRPQLTSLLSETHSTDTDFIHRSAIEFQPDDGGFGGFEWLGSSNSLKRGKRDPHGLEYGFPILVVCGVVHLRELCKLLLEWRGEGEEDGKPGAGGPAGCGSH